MTQQAITEELQMAQTQLLSQDNDFAIDEVIAILNNQHENSTEEMDTEDLREILSVWRTYNKEDNSQTSSMNRLEISEKLNVIKKKISDKSKFEEESLSDSVDKETENIFNIVSKMNVNENTTEKQILEYNDEELAFFQYTQSLQMQVVPDIDDLKESGRSQLVRFCKEWVKSLKTKKAETKRMQVFLSENDDKLYDPNLETESILENVKLFDNDDEIVTDKEVSEEEDDEQQSMEIDEADQKEAQINLDEIKEINQFQKLSNKDKCKWIQKASTSTGNKINLKTIELWPDTQLTKTAQTLMHPMEQPESKKTTKSSLKSVAKYAGKPTIQTNLQQNIMKPWRYSIFITSSLEKKSVEGLTSYLSDIFHEMGSFCPGIQLLPWDSETFDDGIEDCEDVPKTISQLKKYFKGARSPAGSITKQYLKIRLGYPILSDKATFEADVMEWCKERNIRMYECALQHPNTKIIGWLAYIPNTVDRLKWCKATQEIYQMVNKDGSKDDIKVGIVWKALNGQWEVQQKQKVYAFHVETSVDQSSRIKKFLRLVAQNKKFPLGVRYRLCDEYTQYMKETLRAKYTYMLDKHKTLCKEMRQVETGGILNLDRKIGDSKLTLQDLVLAIRDKTDDRRVFNSIDHKYNNPSLYVAQYRPDKAELAKAHILSLVTYVRHIFPQANLCKIFTIDAIDESEVEKYFPNTQTFITQEDIDFDAVIQEDLDDDSFEYLNINNVNPFEIQLPEKLKGGEKLYNLNGDDDTASTMPAQSSTISFSNASVHLYDTRSLVSEISNLSDKNKQPPKMKAKSINDYATDEKDMEEAPQA